MEDAYHFSARDEPHIWNVGRLVRSPYLLPTAVRSAGPIARSLVLGKVPRDSDT